MKSILFMLGKDPQGPDAGDVVMSRLVMSLARSSFSVRAVALHSGDRCLADDIDYLPKPNINKRFLFVRSAVKNRSLIHTRFNTSELRSYLRSANADRFVAEHSYMGEAFMSVRRSDASSQLVVNTHVPESLVLRGTYGPIIGPEAQRTARDESRIGRRARAVGAFDRDEARDYASKGVPRSFYLSLTLPPGVRAEVRTSPRTLVFVGDLSWAPNRSALAAVIDTWHLIRTKVPEAELRLIGNGTKEYAASAPPGVVGLGYVPDLGVELLNARALIAPITVGGGVRVKLLEAVSIGLPVIGSRTAVGTLDTFLPINVSASPEEIVERAVHLLLDASYAASEGSSVYAANVEIWRSGAHEQLVAEWLA